MGDSSQADHGVWSAPGATTSAFATALSLSVLLHAVAREVHDQRRARQLDSHDEGSLLARLAAVSRTSFAFGPSPDGGGRALPTRELARLGDETRLIDS